MTVGPCKLCGKMVEIDDHITAHEWARIVAEAPPGRASRVEADITSAAERFAPITHHQVCIDAFNDAAEKRRRKAFRAERIAKWQRFTPFRDTDIHQIPFTAKIEALQTFSEPGVSVALIGPKRRGKTRLAFLMVEPHYLAGRDIRVFSHIGLKNTLLKKSTDGGSWMFQFIEQLKGCDVLFLDDLGKATMVDANGRGLQIEEQFFDVLDHRLMHRKKTLLTMNDIDETLMARMSKDRGGPFVARIGELARVFAG